MTIPYGALAQAGATAQALKAQQQQQAGLPWWLLLAVAVAFLVVGRSRGSKQWR